MVGQLDPPDVDEGGLVAERAVAGQEHLFASYLEVGRQVLR